MLSAIKNTLVELKDRFKMMPIIYITILILDVVIFFYQDVPESYVPIILLSSTVVFFLSDYVTNLSKIKKWIITILIYVFISQIYYFFLTTYNPLIEQSALSLMYLYLFFSINLYLSSNKNYVLEMKSKVIHIFVSLAIFVATYMFLFFSIFFIYAILSKSFSFFYGYSYSYRAVNSIATVAFFSILSLYKKRENYTSSKFFSFVFSRLVPPMLLIFLLLAIIYFLKVIFVYDSSIDFVDFNYITPIITFTIFLSLIMIQITCNARKILRLLFALAIIISIEMIVFYFRYAELSSSIHYLLIYLLVASYFLTTLIKTKGITYLASYVISLTILIYFIPVFGLINYEKFINEKNSNMNKNNIAIHQERKERRITSQKEDSEHFYYNAPDSSKKVRWIIKNENYSDMLIDISIESYQDNKYSENNNFVYKDYDFSLSKDGKKLIMKNAIKNIEEEFDLYTIAKNSKKDELIEFNTQNFKLILSRYSFSKYNKSIDLNVYFYNNEK